MEKKNTWVLLHCLLPKKTLESQPVQCNAVRSSTIDSLPTTGGGYTVWLSRHDHNKGLCRSEHSSVTSRFLHVYSR